MNTESISLLETKEQTEIKDLIYTFRGKQVMLDSDLAVLFNVETKRLIQQTKRNINRFPEDFCFQLNSEEFRNLRLQNVSSSYGGRRYLPYVYTEHGIIALASVLKSDIAAEMSVKIVRAFVESRKLMYMLQEYSFGLTTLRNDFYEFKDETTRTLGVILKRMENEEPLKEGLFLNGQWFDAFDTITNLIKKAKKSIVLVDPYADKTSLVYLSHKSNGVALTIYKSEYSKLSIEEAEIFEKQYGKVILNEFNESHNRYLILDSNEVYDLGTSLNKAGNKIFTINRIEVQKIADAIIELFK